MILRIRLQKNLNLKTIGTQKVSIKTFGQEVEEKSLEKVKVKDGKENIYVKLMFQIQLAQERYEPLRHVQLAESNPDAHPMSIDILIGATDYWNLFGYKPIQCRNGPTVLQSKLGYVLSGPIENSRESVDVSSYFVSAHTLKAVTEFSDSETILRNDCKKLWFNKAGPKFLKSE